MEVCKIITYVLCVLLLISACSSFGGGLYLIFGFHHMNHNVLPTFEEAKTKIEIMIKAINLYPKTKIQNPPNVSSSIPLVDIRLIKVLQGFGYYLATLGGSIVAICVTAFIGTYRKSKRLQYIVVLVKSLIPFGVSTVIFNHAVILAVVILIVELISLVLHIIAKDLLRKHFLSELNSSFKSLRSHDDFSIGWNLVMQQYNCCGINGYLDFNRSNSFDEVWAQPFHSFARMYLYITAISCCNSIYIKPGPSPERFNGPCLSSDYITKKGCMDVLWDVIEDYRPIILACILLLMTLKVLFMVANCVYMKKSMTEQVRIDTVVKKRLILFKLNSKKH